MPDVGWRRLRRRARRRSARRREVHQAREAPETLALLVRVQAHHFRAGFPCPEPFAGPLPVGDRYATIDAYVDEGGQVDTHDPPRRRLMAQALARHLELARECEAPPALARGWSAYPTDRLCQRMRTILASTWCARPAAPSGSTRSQPARSPSLHAPRHRFWATTTERQHFRFVADRITVVYDWDSLRLGMEAVIVGNAACGFTANFDWGDVGPAPTPDEVRAFVDEYDEARGPRLTCKERQQIAACGLYLLAYTARCEHAHADREAPFTGALQRHGDRYLVP